MIPTTRKFTVLIVILAGIIFFYGGGSIFQSFQLLLSCRDKLSQLAKMSTIQAPDLINLTQSNSDLKGESWKEDSSVGSTPKNHKEAWKHLQLKRKRKLQSECKKIGEEYGVKNIKDLVEKKEQYRFSNLLIDYNHKAIYCYIPKVACTQWKKIMMLLDGKTEQKNLTLIDDMKAHYNSKLKSLSSPDLKKEEIMDMLLNFKKFLVVRHPLERLLSAYNNKFKSESNEAKVFKRIYAYHMMVYSRNSSKDVPETGDGMKFSEFLEFIVSQNPSSLQEHWAPYFHLCHPCAINYDFIAKYESLSVDSNMILAELDAPSWLKFPDFKPSNTKDALKDIISALPSNLLENVYNNFFPDYSIFNYSKLEL